MDPVIRRGDGDFTYEELQFLEAENLCKPSAVSGKRKVSAAFLSSPRATTSSLSSSSTTSSASVRSRNFASTIKDFDIPIAAYSPEALEFIGLTSQVATTIFQRHQARPDPSQNPDELIDYVYGHILLLNSRHCADMTLRGAMTRIGLTQSLQDALTDSRYTDIFWTQSLHYWVKDTLRVNYATLLLLQRRLKTYARGGCRKPERASVQNIFPEQAASGAQPEYQPPQITTTLNMTPRDHNLPANHISLETEGPLLPGHITLYKVKCPAEMMDDQWIQDDGSINMSVLATHPGGDFNHDGLAWYWTPGKEVAEKYRTWAALRSPWTETWLIRVQIPSNFMNGLRTSQLWFSPNWKEYVWNCKKRRLPPAKLDHLWKDVDVMRGHICTGNTTPITRIKQGDVQTSINSDSVLTYGDDNQKAIQVVFLHREIAERMGEVIRGKIHIEITAAAQLHSAGAQP